MLTHGKVNTWRQGCKCELCLAARRKELRDIWKRTRAGESLYRPAEEGQRIVLELRAMGWTNLDIAREGYMNANTVYRIGNGHRKYVHVETLKTLTALLERGKKRERHGGRVRSDLLIKAIRGLQAQGWPAWWIAEQVGATENSIRQYTRGEWKWVSPEREQAVVQLARRVGSQLGPNNHVRSISLNKGWKPTIWVDELV